MPNIPDIGVHNLNIRPIGTNPIFDLGTPRILVPTPPVTTYLQKPIVAYPGCVEHAIAVEDNKKSIRCDGEIPSYEPLEYEPEQMTITRPTPVPKTPKSETPSPTTAPETPLPAPPSTANTKEETTTEEPEIPWTEEYLPPLGTVTTTASIAVIATTSALLAKPLADLLLKLVKPTVKKVVKKISKIRGKKEVVLSLRERRQDQSELNHAKLALRKMLKGK